MFNQRKLSFIVMSGILLGTILYSMHVSLLCFNETVGNQEPVRFATMEKISPLKYHFTVLGSVFKIEIDNNLIREVKCYSIR